VTASVAATATYLGRRKQKEPLAWALAELREAGRRSPDEPDLGGRDGREILAGLRRRAVRWGPAERIGAPGISVRRARLRATDAGSKPVFRRIDGRRMGFADKDRRRFEFFRLKPSVGDSIASGDFNRDGWDDVLVGTEVGLQLYANFGGTRFERQKLVTGFEPFIVASAAFVDIDDDAWPDIVFSAWRRGLYVLRNVRGEFPRKGLRLFAGTSGFTAPALGFGDIDRDGDIDIVHGSHGTHGATSGPIGEWRDMILRGQGSDFRPEPLPGVTTEGQTLSTLLSDLDGDGRLDLFVGNDFQPPDVVYLTGGRDRWRPIRASDGIFPHSTQSTMSVDSADIDGDGDLEVYLGQITWGSGTQRSYSLDEADRACGLIKRDLRARCASAVRAHALSRPALGEEIKKCADLGAEDRSPCIAQSLEIVLERYRVETPFEGLTDEDVDDICQTVHRWWEFIRPTCPMPAQVRQDFAKEVPSIKDRNVLLDQNGGAYSDEARSFGVSEAGWTWNAQFADFDGDGWEDLFAVNGGWFRAVERLYSHVLYRNHGGRGFRDVTKAAGLVDYRPTGAYTFADFDNDGDLDIITAPYDAPVVFYRNQISHNSSVIVELDDELGNRAGIGSLVTVTDARGRKQQREIKSSGGYLSFNAPRAHFGLGRASAVREISVRWSTGETSRIAGPFPAGFRYRISRAG
jgi:hypothetical protein